MAALEVERFRGRLISTTGDGALATFDRAGAVEPLRVRAARLRSKLDLQLRQGIHIGEVEPRGSDIGRDRSEHCRARAATAG
jgi:class 3 adenylate cyclase